MKPSPLAAAVILLLSAAACAPDVHGDLRSRVAVNPAGAQGRLTFDGVGEGSPREDAVAAFGDGWAHPAREADFGTRLEVLWSAPEGEVRGVVLRYGGNPRALAKVAARWQEVLRAAGADCGEGSCFWREGEKMLATLYVDDRWWGPAELLVTIGG